MLIRKFYIFISSFAKCLFKYFAQFLIDCYSSSWGSLVAQTVKCLPAMRETPGLIPGSGRFPGEGNGNPLQYSCLENSMDGGAWCATVHGVEKSRTQLSDFTHAVLLSDL